MSMINDYSNRQLVPRLLSSETANVLSLNFNTANKNLSQINTFELHNYYKLRAEWKLEKNSIIAIQMLAYEIIYDSLTVNEELLVYLDTLKSRLNQIEKDIISIANNKLTNNAIQVQSDNDDNVKTKIKNLKLANISYPFSALQWCDLGYCYIKLGLRDKARKAFLISIELNNSNRHIVRSVARFFQHIGDIEYGHQILSMSPRIRSDPNIISAEIAFSELMGKKSKFIDAGIKLKDDSNISILEKNELLAQIATLEFAHGKNSKGKILINQCLINPNENSLAQIAFLEKKRFIDPVAVTSSSAIFQFEALARHHFSNANFQKSYEYAKLWYNFQPFTNFPATFSTYIAIELLGKYQEAIDIAEEALKISPNSISLKNNLAFSYAKNGQSDKACRIINGINRSGLDNYNKAILNATAGYIAYKIGDIDSAKYGYNEAITYFRLNKDEESLARALYNYADILDKNEKISVLKEVEELSNKNNLIELKYLLEKRYTDTIIEIKPSYLNGTHQ